MATFISDTRIAHLQTSPQAYEYVTLTGDCTRSGNTVTLSNLSVSVRVSYVYSAYGENQNYYIASSQYGSALTQTGSFTFNFNDGPNHTESHSMPNMSISVGVSDTSKTLYLRASSNEDAQIPFTVTFPSGSVAPTTPTVAVTNTTGDSITIVYGTTSFGTPSTGTVTLYGGTTSNPTTVIATSSTTGDNTFVHTGLTQGTTYYYRAKASNGQLDSNYSTEVSSTTKAIALYGSVNGLSKKVQKLYGSWRMLTGFAEGFRSGSGRIGSINLRTFTTMLLNTYPVFKWRTDYRVNTIIVAPATTSTFSLQIGTTLGGTISVGTMSAYDLESLWGIQTVANGFAAVGVIPQYDWRTRQIQKLYGSVGGLAKQIF